MKPAALWPVAIAGVLAVTVAANVAVMVLAGGPDRAPIEPDYYRKAVAWDSTLAQDDRDAALGWTLDARLEPHADGAMWIEARLAGRDGAPLDGAAIDVEAIHNRAPRPEVARLAPAGVGGYRARLPVARPGLWELRFTAIRAGVRFTHTVRLDAGMRLARGAPRAAGAGS